jgi:hypothetical protein
VFDLGRDVVWAPPTAEPSLASGIIGAAARSPAASVATGLKKLGVTFLSLPWSADEVRALVREMLRLAGKLGH